MCSSCPLPRHVCSELVCPSPASRDRSFLSKGKPPPTNERTRTCQLVTSRPRSKLSRDSLHQTPQPPSRRNPQRQANTRIQEPLSSNHIGHLHLSAMESQPSFAVWSHAKAGPTQFLETSIETAQ